MTQEIFKDILNYEGLYQVSNLGNVKSLNRLLFLSNGKSRRIKSRILKQSKHRCGGYFQVILYNKCIKKSWKIHQLMAMSFLNHKPNGFNGLIVDHKNNIKHDNRLENIQLITQRENMSKNRVGISSSFTGVTKSGNTWRSIIRYNGNDIHLGMFKTEQIASQYYQNAVISIENGTKIITKKIWKH